MSDFVPVAWEYRPEEVRELSPVCVELVRNCQGVIRFAIRQSGACMDAEGKWDFEPIPSSRTDEWLQRFRFATLEEAQAAVRIHCVCPYGRFHGDYCDCELAGG